MKPIDWTKPIRHVAALGETVLVGRDGEKYIVRVGSQYTAYFSDGSYSFENKKQWIENIPEETVVYVYSWNYRGSPMVCWAQPDKVEWVKKEYKNCLLSMQKVVLKEGQICGS